MWHDNATWACFQHNEMNCRRRPIDCCEWRLRHGWLMLMYQYWRIAFVSQVVSLSSRITIGSSADELYLLWCPSSSCAVFPLNFIWSEGQCLLNCALSTDHSLICWGIGISSSIYSLLISCAFKSSNCQMRYRMLHYTDFVNAFT